MSRRCSTKNFKFRRYQPTYSCTAVYGPNFLPYFFFGFFFHFFRISGFLADLGQHLLGKFSSRLRTRSGENSCAPHTSYGEVNDSVVKSERGVRGSDPPLVHSPHTTAGDVWPTRTRLLLDIHFAVGVWKTQTRTLDCLPAGKKNNLSGLDERPQNSAGNLSRPKAWINMNSSTLLPSLMWPCPERRALVVGCLDLEIEGQSWSLDNIDGGLMEIDKLGR